MKPFLILAVLMAPVAMSQEKAEDRTIMVSSEDRDMAAAIRHAQETLDGFLAILTKPPKGASGFKIMVKVEDAGEVEHFWVTPFMQTSGGFAGTIANAPELVHSIKLGQTYRFSRSAISDWGYVLNGKQKGSFTVCVLFKQMPKKEADVYRKDYGFEC